MSRPRVSRPAGREPPVRPLYARVLRLRHVQPSATACFILLEGSIAAALVLALAELVSWWGLIALPVGVALVAKVSDIGVGRMDRSAAEAARRERHQRQGSPAVGRATVPVSPAVGRGPFGDAPRRTGTVYRSRRPVDHHPDPGVRTQWGQPEAHHGPYR